VKKGASHYTIILCVPDTSQVSAFVTHLLYTDTDRLYTLERERGQLIKIQEAPVLCLFFSTPPINLV
jgi:uncharacterized membrane protein